MCRSVASAVLVLSAISASYADGDEWPRFDAPTLQLGREIWIGTCEGCHAHGIAGAPVATSYPSWAPRIAQGRPTLYEHAINGFFGPGGTYMPERGGNSALSDHEVRAAVDYMIETSIQHQ